MTRPDPVPTFPRMRALAILLLFALSGCKSEPAAPDAGVEPTLATVTADRTDLMFRYRTEDGFASATTLDEIPADKRQAVLVNDLTLTPEQRGAGRFVQVFDLRQAGPDGRFPGKLVPRAELEATLAELQKVAPPAPVTMYSAAWCGVCTKARKYLQEAGIPFVEKDIEKDKGAAQELQAKAKAAGVSASGVPVFDVGGKIMSGFDPNALQAALARK